MCIITQCLRLCGPRAAVGPVTVPSSIHHLQVLWEEARGVRSLPRQVEA